MRGRRICAAISRIMRENDGAERGCGPAAQEAELRARRWLGGAGGVKEWHVSSLNKISLSKEIDRHGDLR